MEKIKLNLHQKLLKIADMAGVLQRTKAGYGYKYVPEEDIQAKVTAGMQRYGVMLYTYIQPGSINVTPYCYSKYDKKEKCEVPVNEVLVSATTIYKWVDVDDPESFIETPWAFVGQMEDASQAFGAGLTYSNRYYLMKQLQLATTESDPDAYRSKQKEAENYDEIERKKAEKAELTAKIKEVVELGTTLIKSGTPKENVAEVVAKFNNGNSNPSTIPSKEICDKIVAELKKSTKNK